MEGQLATYPPPFFDSFCTCLDRNSNTLQCNCGEEYSIDDWTWDKNDLKNCTLLNNKRDVFFHGNFVVGTVRGELPFQPNRHYYWEIKMLDEQYGDEIDFGVGADNVRFNTRHGRFRVEGDYWGYSFRGGAENNYSTFIYIHWFQKGSIIGVHLDTCNGTLEFYNNRRPLGVAYTGLKGMQLYPMVWCRPIHARTVRLTCALSITPSLQLLSILTLRKNKNVSLASSIDQVPGLQNMLASRFWWLMGPEQTQQHEDKHAIVSSPSSSHETGPSSSRKRKRQRAESSNSDSEDDDE